MTSRLRLIRRRAWVPVASILLIGAATAAGLGVASGASAPRRPPRSRSRGLPPVSATGRWIASWGASPQTPPPQSFAHSGLAGDTIRDVVFSSAGGSSVRVRFTNVFGNRPLEIGAAAIGIAGTGATVRAGTAVRLSFGGRSRVTIAPGQEAVSDAAALRVPALTDMAVSLYLPHATGPVTEHALARQLNYQAAGNRVHDGGGAFTTQTQAWLFVSGIDVLSHGADPETIVALGDSITDGFRSLPDANGRWPNDLARRVEAITSGGVGVVDEGIGGNRVLHGTLCCGQSAMSRFRRDVLDQPGVRTVILFEGINDIGHSRTTHALRPPRTSPSAAQIIAGDKQIIRRAHAAGLRIFGATLTPFQGAGYWTPEREATRTVVNHWIRTSAAFDGVIDFASSLADPADPMRLDPAYDSGDHLHPNDAGYRAMANAVDITTLLGR